MVSRPIFKKSRSVLLLFQSKFQVGFISQYKSGDEGEALHAFKKFGEELQRGGQRRAGRFRLPKKLQALERKYEGLPTTLQHLKTALTEYVAILEKKTALADTKKRRLQDKLSISRAEFESFWRCSKKKLHDLTTSYAQSQTFQAQCEKNRVQYYVEKRQLSSCVDGQEVEKSTLIVS